MQLNSRQIGIGYQPGRVVQGWGTLRGVGRMLRRALVRIGVHALEGERVLVELERADGKWLRVALPVHEAAMLARQMLEVATRSELEHSELVGRGSR